MVWFAPANQTFLAHIVLFVFEIRVLPADRDAGFSCNRALARAPADAAIQHERLACAEHVLAEQARRGDAEGVGALEIAPAAAQGEALAVKELRRIQGERQRDALGKLVVPLTQAANIGLQGEDIGGVGVDLRLLDVVLDEQVVDLGLLRRVDVLDRGDPRRVGVDLDLLLGVLGVDVARIAST
jgi:hypothetical protein